MARWPWRARPVRAGGGDDPFQCRFSGVPGGTPTLRCVGGGNGAVAGGSRAWCAADTDDNNQTPLVALPCDGSFQDAGQILQLG
jgi:hypothetical protein